jgi:predicted RNA-binding Zn-ribbon protein involved in translation (DUF1610 family)
MLMMDTPEVFQIMSRKGLLGDPAFDDLKVDIEPIPCFDGCPLGLYFPEDEYVREFRRLIPEGTIIIPPTGQEGTVLHELGHRYGDYYFNNLSENYAESFRQRYQGPRAMLYLGDDFHRIKDFGVLFREGERGAVEFGLMEPLTPHSVAYLNELVNSFNCECTVCGYPLQSENHCYQLTCPRCGGQMRRANRPRVARVVAGEGDVPWARVEFAKSADFTVIIGSLLAASIVAAVGAIGYAVYKVSKEASWVVPVALAGVGSFLILRAALRSAKARA